MSETVKIVPSILKQQVEEGWKLKPLAEHYGLPVSQMKKALQSQGLRIRKFHAPKFEFVAEESMPQAPGPMPERAPEVETEVQPVEQTAPGW